MLTAKLICRRKRAGTARSAADILVLAAAPDQACVGLGNCPTDEEGRSSSASALRLQRCLLFHSMDAVAAGLLCYCHTNCNLRCFSCSLLGRVLKAVFEPAGDARAGSVHAVEPKVWLPRFTGPKFGRQ